MAEYNLLDKEVHKNMLPYDQFPKNNGYQHACLDTVLSTEHDRIQNSFRKDYKYDDY